MACHANYPLVLTVPLHRVTAHWWDAHRGPFYGTRLNRHGEERIGSNASEIPLDCTHFCNSPFMYQPLWWAIGRVASTLPLMGSAVP